MLPCIWLLLASLSASALATIPRELEFDDLGVNRAVRRDNVTANGFQYGVDRIRGVNLGGWLLSEPFIVPSLYRYNYSDFDYNVVDEFTLGKKRGKQGATDWLRPHWESFITQEDFVKIKSYGLNHVRIPIGYWSVVRNDSEPFAFGAYDYLIRAVDEWARGTGIRVLIDLHGAPGSQNSYDNSGRRGEARWFNSTDDIARTKAALGVLVDEFSQPKYIGVVAAIAVLNEPAAYLGAEAMASTWQYYRDAYRIVRSGGDELLVVFHDAFQPPPFWQYLYPEPSYHNVMMDSHYYSMFDAQTVLLANNNTALDALVCSRAANNSILNEHLWSIIGEFTAATTDCAPQLNGVSAPVRWTTAGNSCAGYTSSLGLSASYIEVMRRYVETQIRQYEKASGFFFWTWKTEISAEWSYSAGVEMGFIPNPPDNYTYPDPCPSLDLSLTSNEGAVYKVPLASMASIVTNTTATVTATSANTASPAATATTS